MKLVDRENINAGVYRIEPINFKNISKLNKICSLERNIFPELIKES